MSKEDQIYKQHYACFRCRKAFKKTNIREVAKQNLQIDEQGRKASCPQCGERMPEVGYDFEAPKQNDLEAWQRAEECLKNSLDYAIRNSSIVNIQSRRKLMRFIRDYGEKNRIVISTDNEKSSRRKKGKE